MCNWLISRHTMRQFNLLSECALEKLQGKLLGRFPCTILSPMNLASSDVRNPHSKF